MRTILLSLFLLIAPVGAWAQTPAPSPPDPAGVRSAADALAAAPKVEIGNGVLKATLLLPNKERGFYRGVRFDRGGMIASVKYGDREFYGLWFDQMAPDVRDFVHVDGRIIAGPNTAVLGPADAYDPTDPMGWKEAPLGGTFLKIGVGILRKPMGDGAYSSFRTYDIVDAGLWKVSRKSDRVVFTHKVSDPANGYGYEYRKVVRLLNKSPVLLIEHRLRNTGTKPINSISFNHNFLTFGGAPTQSGVEVSAGFAIHPTPPPLADVADLRGGRLRFHRALAGQERISTTLGAFDAPGGPYDVSIHNAQGAGVRIEGDIGLRQLPLWGIRTTLAAEPYIQIKVAPRQSVSWTFRYTYAAGQPK